MKLRTEHKIAIGAVALFAGGYFGWNAFAAAQVDRIQFETPVPGRVNFVGINAGRGFKIIVSNQVAQLVQLSKGEDFEAGDIDENATDDEGDRRRVPLRELLETLQGNEKSLGYLVTTLNEPLRKVELPPNEVLWDAADLQKALSGDASKRAKLEQDLNVRLDGTPLDTIRPSALANGIVIQAYIPIKVKQNDKLVTMRAPIKIPYRARFAAQVHDRYKEQFTPTREVILGYYLEAAKALAENPRNKENVAEGLKNRIDEKGLYNLYGSAPEKILSEARVIVNNEHLKSARVEEVAGPDGKRVADIRVDLTDEGRKRLWQFSRRNTGQQLLIIVDGIAIAAPRIRQELAQGDLVIRQVQDITLAKDAATTINELAKS